MGAAKQIRIEPISSRVANNLVLRGHYSGKVTQNSQLHLGVFMAGRLLGALQFGPPMDRRKVLGLVRGSQWDSVLELNRMWLSDELPRNGESRSIGVACRMLRQHAPQVKWVLSFADATQCGDGTVYRAAGFALTSIKANKQVLRLRDGSVVSNMTYTKGAHILKSGAARKPAGAEPLQGYQFRYIKFIDSTWRDRLTVPEIPYSDIPQECRMYKGKRQSEGKPPVQGGKGGASPTLPLQSSGVKR